MNALLADVAAKPATLTGLSQAVDEGCSPGADRSSSAGSAATA